MNKLNLSNLLALGNALRYWNDVSNGAYRTWIRGEQRGMIGLLDSMEKNISFLKQFDLCKNTCNEIETFIKKIDSKYKSTDELNDDDKEILQRKSVTWRDRLENNFDNFNVFLLNHNYLLNPELLFDGAIGFFREDIWNLLKDNEKNDLNESFKCIMFELPTSAGIISLRSTESVLRRYYETKKGTVLTGFLDWSKIITELKLTNANQKLLDHLDYLRENLRNKLAHPDSNLTQQESERILPMIIQSIEEMILDF